MRQKNFLISRQYCTYRQGRYTRRHSTSTEKHMWKQAMPCRTAAGRELNTGTRDTAWQHGFLPMSQIFPLNCTSPCQAAQSPQGRHYPGFVLTTARVNARSCWFHPPFFFTGDCVCVFKTATNDSLHNITHCAKSVQDYKNEQTILTSFFCSQHCSIFTALFALKQRKWAMVPQA